MNRVILQHALVGSGEKYDTRLHAKPPQSLEASVSIIGCVMENGLEFLLHSMNKIRTKQLFKVFITSTKHCDFKRHRRRHGGWVQNLMQVKKSGEALHSVFYYNLAGWTCCVLLAVHVFSGSEK